jgi:hypothetical protein
MSSIGIVHGVTAQFKPFCRNEDTQLSSFWPLRLMTVSFEVFVVGFCVLWSPAYYRKFMENELPRYLEKVLLAIRRWNVTT